MMSTVMKWFIFLSLPLLVAARCQLGACCGGPPPGPYVAGAYCTTISDGDNVSSLPVDIHQSGDDVIFYTEEVILTGTFYGNSVNVQGTMANGEKVSANIDFRTGLDGFEGELYLPGKTYGFNAVTGQCYEYQDPAGQPECILPITDGAPIDDGQQYNAVFNDVRHSGLDFAYSVGIHEIRAPCAGVVTGLYREELSLGNIAHSVELRFNKQWRILVGFEPYSSEPSIVEQQRQAITASLNQVVKAGDALGYLIAPGTVFPHIHWQMDQVVEGIRSDACPRDFLTVGEATRLDTLFAGLDRSPACYAMPTVVNY